MRWKQSPRSSAVPQGGLDPHRTGRALPSQPFPGAQRFLSSRWFRGEKLVWVVNLALLALLGYVLWGVLASRADAVRTGAVRWPTQAAKPTPPVETPADASGIGSILGATGNRLSGDAAETPTQLPLRLLGTIAGDPSVARAIIEEGQGKTQNLYRVGQSVAGARIEEIGRNSVVLLVNGQREILEMALGSSPEGTPEPPKGPAPSPGKVAEVIKSPSPHNFQIINKQALLTMIGGYEAIFKAVEDKVKPYNDGKVKGLQINGLDDISMAPYVGLQNGDVIASVNGQNLDTMQKAWQVFQKARNQPDLDVQIMRGDSAIPLHFSLSGD